MIGHARREVGAVAWRVVVRGLGGKLIGFQDEFKIFVA
jgi:hypothetical protein